MSDSRASTRWRWLAVPVCALALYVIVRAANTPQGDTPSTGASASTSAPRTGSAPSTRSAPPSASATSSVPAPASSYDPAGYAPQVRTRARQTGISAQLLMAILYNESYKPHDPSFERAWQKYKPDAAFGIANMHRATFDEVRKGRDFAGRRWDELPDDRDLAIEAEAWYLHDLAAQLPATWPASYSKNELLALGYNTGAGNMLAFARGAPPGSQAQSYLDKLHANWTKAARAVGAG
ncbi:transglycosylase SLT domain-containing protein [Streptomyces sp. Li-HN-5-11]|uniref:transglycosylase SLT domain-containing protein n=1 Tax=Streptomyces sp. Li-HN-5-11 TaxID=3075432 RepID=UPI0028A779CF|nr:transglycosylase SLT domain-containing protein [Streptomyces sp. Li-HN-5-11]WNM36592.1 transglycosylase SLT domain-containing protein [Streptomyces sp. Li-HN-5-11]